MKAKIGIVLLLIVVVVVSIGVSTLKEQSNRDVEKQKQIVQKEHVAPKKDKEPPTISLITQKLVIEKGVEIDYAAQIGRAKDGVDGTITKNVKWNTIDTKKVGEYTVTYMVKDQAGNKAKALLVVVVKEQKNNPNYAPTAEDDH